MDLLYITSLRELFHKKMVVTIDIHGAEEIPEKYSTEVFAEYQWIDNNAKWYETKKSDEKKKNTKPVWNYSETHKLYVNNHIVDNL